MQGNAAAWLTKREVAEIARVSVRTVERAIARGELRASKPDGRGRVIIHRRWLNAWLQPVLVVATCCCLM